MKKLLVLQGLPASGKSTYARELLDTMPSGKVVRVNNDELSEMLFGSSWTDSDYSAKLLTRLRFDIIRQSFKCDAELVIVDNTNLNPKTLHGLKMVALDCGATLELDDSFLSVPIEECLRRNALRQNPVPEKVIKEMAEKFIKPLDNVVS